MNATLFPRWRTATALLLFATVLLPPQARCEESTLHHGKVAEALNAGNYTYLRIEEGGETYWIATPHTMVPKGSTVNFHEQVWMYDFPSKMLNRTFPKVLFTADVVIESSPDPEPAPAPAAPAKSDAAAGTVDDAGTVPIAEIFRRKDELAGKRVTITGHVVKVLDRIMGSSWIHIEDDSGETGNHMVVRTPEHIADEGATVSATGVLKTDVDYGYGYYYPIIIENAAVAVEPDKAPE